MKVANALILIMKINLEDARDHKIRYLKVWE